MKVATTASRSVLPTAVITSPATARLLAIDTPRSPCRARHTHIKNCSGSDRLNPYSSRSCACSSTEASGGKMDTSGSPGARCTSRKHTRATPSMMGRAYRKRRSR
ncbi:hypothetical protein D3C71_1480340 [compost metagenome]